MEIKPIAKITVLILVIFLSAAYYSRKVAVERASKIMHPISNEWSYIGCRPSLLSFENGKYIEKITGVGWKVGFGHKTVFTSDILFYYSFSGNRVANSAINTEKKLNFKN